MFQGKSIRMMGVPKDEIDEVLQNAKADLRIAGFDEEEKRLKQRNVNRSYTSPKLPQGTYIFCDFRTLSLPGIEVNFTILGVKLVFLSTPYDVQTNLLFISKFKSAHLTGR